MAGRQIHISIPDIHLRALIRKLPIALLIIGLGVSIYFLQHYRREARIFQGRLYEVEGQLQAKEERLSQTSEQAESAEIAYQNISYYASLLSNYVQSSHNVLATLASYSDKQEEVNEAAKLISTELVNALRCGSADVNCYRLYLSRATDAIDKRDAAQEEANLLFENFSDAVERSKQDQLKLEELLENLTEDG